MMDMNQYLPIFIEETRDNLQTLNESLLKLEASPSDMQLLNEIFRVAHTLKGMSGTMGFGRMQKLTHQAENVLSEIRSGTIGITSNIIDVLFKCLDALENYIEEIINTSSEGEEEHQELMMQLECIIRRQHTKAVEPEKKLQIPKEVMSIANVAIQHEQSVLEIKVKLSSNCMLKAARAFIVFSELGRIGEIIYSLPSSQEIEDEQFEEEFSLVLITTYLANEVEEIILGVSEVEAVKVFDCAINSKEMIVDSQEKTDPSVVEENIKEEKIEENKKQKQQVSTKSVRVNIERLDTLMNLVSELIIVKTQLEEVKATENKNSEYNDSLEYLERVTTSLHDAVMKVRMVPIESVFNRFPRMIRDIARKLEKDIDLLILGEETELDRTVIDEIGDPLIHLLRNAADHGLETSEERKWSGKEAKGTIRLEAYQDGNSVVIEVSDDGKGIDANKIRKKAMEKGSLTQEALQNMSDQEVIELLFRPSFSTAEQVTDLSGRGVGLDVVKSKITSLGGDVEIVTEVGKGSTFIVRLPLTLAIIQALMVHIGSEKYAIPLSNIQTIEEVSSEEIKFIQRQEVVVLRNQIIPIIRLSKVLGVESTDSQTIMVVIVKKGEKFIGFVVDSLIGQQEIVVKTLGKYLSQIPMIAGATILGNGEVALILDINDLL